MLEMQFLTRNC